MAAWLRICIVALSIVVCVRGDLSTCVGELKDELDVAQSEDNVYLKNKHACWAQEQFFDCLESDLEAKPSSLGKILEQRQLKEERQRMRMWCKRNLE